MRLELGRRAATVTAVAAPAAGGPGMAAGSASASTGVWLNTSHGVGVHSRPGSWSHRSVE